AELLVVRAAFRVGHRVAMKPGGDDGILVLGVRLLGKEVAGDLLNSEAVVRHVVVQRPDHPIAPRPDVWPERSRPVTGGVGVAAEVEPNTRPTLAISGGTQQTIHQSFVGV